MMPDRICQNCEYWDAGGDRRRLTTVVGDCLNPNSDRFTPRFDHTCPAFYLGSPLAEEAVDA